MNLIYTCVFNHESYKMARLLLESISVNVKHSDILIVTTPEFRPYIKLDVPVLIYMSDETYAKMYIFNYEHIGKYDTILYLSPNVLIVSEMNSFDVSDKIHVIQETNSPVMLFKNCESIKTMLETEMVVYVDERLCLCRVFDDVESMTDFLKN